MLALQDKKIFIATNPIDFRASIDTLANFVMQNKKTYLHDGSVYVFYNKHRDKIKCLFWDKNGFVLYYKRLDNCKFKFNLMKGALASLDADELQTILAGYDPSKVERKPLLIENKE